MMEVRKHTQSDSLKLMKIIDLRNSLQELHNQHGPNSPSYITLSLRLGLLEKEYIEERISLLTVGSKISC
jgi:hypothetical protein